jgi:hypothetical protein
VAPDGLTFCWRTHEDVPGWVYLGDSRNGFGLLRREGDGRRPSGRNGTAGAPGAARTSPSRDFGPELESAIDGEFGPLAEILGVSRESIRAMGTRYQPDDGQTPTHYLLPERDAGGRVIGVVQRFLNGAKRMLTGSRRGLCYVPGPLREGPVLVPEGHSDVLAARTLGLQAVGRSSNLGGVGLLVPLLTAHARAGWPVVVVGENDRKPNGEWPGWHGAWRTARQLADGCGAVVWVALPPEGVKDTRSWLNARPVDPEDPVACREAGQEYLAALACRMRAVEPEPGPPDTTVSLICTIGVSFTDLAGLKNERNSHSMAPGSSSGSMAPGSGSGIPDWPGDGIAPSPAFTEVLEAGRHRRPCPRHRVPLLTRKGDPHQGLALRQDCRRAMCRACGPHYRSRWLLHLSNCFLDHPGELHRWRGAASRVGACLQAVRRREGQHAALRLADGAALVVTTVPVAGATPTTPSGAANAVAQVIRGLAAVRQPISTSRGWKLPAPDPPRSDRYDRRGQARPGTYPRVVEQVIDVCPDRVSEVQVGDTPGVRFDMPPGWTDLDIEAFLDGLGGTTPGGPAGG